MGARIKIKQKTVRATLGDKDVMGLFSEMMGGGDSSGTNPAMVYAKYVRMERHADRFVRLLALLRGSSAAQHGGQALGPFVERLQEQQAEVFAAPDLAPFLGTELPTTEDFEKVPPEVKEQFLAATGRAKDSALVACVVRTCRTLIAYKKSLESPEALSGVFLTTMGGVSFCPVPDLPFCFRRAYCDDRRSAEEKELLLTVLHKLYTVGHDMYEALVAPDMDPQEFTHTVMESLAEVKKFIPRCDNAFRKIEESVDLLRERFGGYYGDFVSSGNPMMIMENFVIDVSKTSAASSPQLTREFRTIIDHYRKLHAQSALNPRLKSLFNHVDANFKSIERASQKAEPAGSAPGPSGEPPEEAGEESDGAGGDPPGEGKGPAPPGNPGGESVASILDGIHRLSQQERAGPVPPARA